MTEATRKQTAEAARAAGHDARVESFAPFRLACSCGFVVEGRATRTEARREMGDHLRAVSR